MEYLQLILGEKIKRPLFAKFKKPILMESLLGVLLHVQFLDLNSLLAQSAMISKHLYLKFSAEPSAVTNAAVEILNQSEAKLKFENHQAAIVLILNL